MSLESLEIGHVYQMQREDYKAGPSPSLGHFMGLEAPGSWAPLACIRGVSGAACRPPVLQWLPPGPGAGALMD